MRIQISLSTIALVLASLTPVAARDVLAPGFVYLRDVEPGIIQDMRYATRDNFVGRPLPGYDAGECDLVRENLSLRVYDCYRPTRAVTAFMRWANDGARDNPTKRFYPALEKRTLF